MVMQNDHYTYRVIWSEEDQEHVGLCAEFPSLSWLAADMDSAFKGIRDLVEDIVSDMRETGEPLPDPVTSKNYSGKFQVRVPPDVHRELALEAAESGVSLNRIVSMKLSR